jgi:hypothetical protein
MYKGEDREERERKTGVKNSLKGYYFQLGARTPAVLSVNTTLNEDELVLLVLVLPELLEVLAHGHSLLDEVVEILRDVGGKT